MKHRYSDFIVNEIDETGEVIWFKEEKNLEKWKNSNLRQTLPEDVLKRIEAQEKLDSENQCDMIVPP